MVCARLMHKKKTSKDCDKGDSNNNNNNNGTNNNIFIYPDRKTDQQSTEDQLVLTGDQR